MLPVAILAGGLATRMRPMTEKTPKALLEVRGEPFIFYQLRLLARSGVDKVVVCTGYLGTMIKDALRGSEFGFELYFSDDGPKPLGTGGALKKALTLLGDKFLVLYGDSWLEIDYASVASAFVSCKDYGLMTVYDNHGLYDASNVLFRNGRILAYDKKNPVPEMRHIDYGLGCLDSAAFYDFPDVFDLADLYSALCAKGSLAGYEVNRRFYEIGSPAGLKEFSEYMATQKY